MRAHGTVVRGGEAITRPVAPSVDDAVEGARIETRPVCEDDHRGLDVLAQSLEAAAQRCAGAALPVGALDDAGVRLEAIRARDDHDLVDRARADASQDLRQEPLLFR
jgi:hypothetical protein